MNRVTHFEIHADDMERAMKFYGDAFGWQFQQMGPEFGNYVLIMTGPGPDEIAAGNVTMENVGINGGMTPRKGPRPEPGAPVNGYACIIGVANIDETMKKIEAAGGTIALPKMDVPNVGLLAYYHDTEGNIFGVIQPTMPAQQ